MADELDPDLPVSHETIAEIFREAEETAARNRPAPRYTALGTPCSKAWDDPWIDLVNHTEARLGRPICGARTMAGVPCTLPPTQQPHDDHGTRTPEPGTRLLNGRCRFHGGFDLTGAPKGNRNAVLHGLYSRRLQVCGPHCPQWDLCPCAGDDVPALDPKLRPTCPYEQTEYNAFLTDITATCDVQPHPDPADKHFAHHLALLHVMTNRAANALRAQQLTDTTAATAEHYQMHATKLNAALHAFLRLSAEYRASRKHLDQHLALRAKHGQSETPTTDTVLCHDTRRSNDTDLRPEAQHAVSLRDEFPGDPPARRFIRDAFQAAAHGADTALFHAFDNAMALNPLITLKHFDAILAAYRPNAATLPKDAVTLVLKHLGIDPRALYPDHNPKHSPRRRRTRSPSPGSDP